jgi:hypothetical protein
MKAVRADLVLDPATRQSELEQLPVRHHAVLLRGHLSKLFPANPVFSIHVMDKSGFGGFRPPWAASEQVFEPDGR